MMNLKKNIGIFVLFISVLVSPMRADALVPLPTFDRSRIAQVLVKTANQIIINNNKIVSNEQQLTRNTEIGTGLDSWSKYSQILDDAMNEYNRYGDMKKAILSAITKNGEEFAQEYMTKVENKLKAEQEAREMAKKKKEQRDEADAAARETLQEAIEKTKVNKQDSISNWYNSQQNPVGGTINVAPTGSGTY